MSATMFWYFFIRVRTSLSGANQFNDVMFAAVQGVEFFVSYR